MATERQNNYLIKWIESLQSKGLNSFTYKQVLNEFTNLNEQAIISSLTRVVLKKKIVSVYKGFYLILRPEDYTKGIISPVLFVDSLMSYLERPYYVGLLSAAALYGAAHQRPQEFFVMIQLPQIRPTEKEGIKINYIGRTNFNEKWLIDRKTEVGYIKVSSPELTAVDLIQYQKHAGGLNRVATVLNELAEQMDSKKINSDLIGGIPLVYLQRLGYILENYSDNPELADTLYSEIVRLNKAIRRQALNPEGSIAGFKTDKKWKLIINTKIEID
jgi:predicted transcriptional regulator of viral defense system